MAKLLVLRGFKDFPWNSAGREFVSLFFDNDVIPYYNPYMKDTLATPADVTPEDTAPKSQVSDNSLSKERKLEISNARKVKYEQADLVRSNLMSEVEFNSFMKNKSKALQIREKINDSQKKRNQTWLKFCRR